MFISFLKTTPALYAYLLFRLHKIHESIDNKNIVWSIIQYLRTSFINHASLNKENIISHLRLVEPFIEEKEFSDLINIVHRSCNKTISIETRWENLFHRRFESYFAIELLKHPTKEIIEATQIVSKQIIALLKEHYSSQKELIDNFIAKMTVLSQEPEVFCKINKENISFDEVLTLLEENNPENIGSIWAIHYLFARHIYRQLTNASRSPVTESQTIVFQFLKREYPHTIFDAKLDDLKTNKCIRLDFIDKETKPKQFFGSLRSTRGRGAFNDRDTSHYLGILLRHQYTQDLPKLHEKCAWSPDVICQTPLFNSPYVKETIENDLIYVAGPSGMTQLQLSTIELLGCFTDPKLKEAYFLCILAYITGGGLHSIDEILNVAHTTFNYFPSYQRGQYQIFFEYFQNNADFTRCLNNTWNNFNEFLTNCFTESKAPPHLQAECEIIQINKKAKHKKPFFIIRKNLQRELKKEYRAYFESKLAAHIIASSSVLHTVHKVSRSICKILVNNKETIIKLIETFPEIEKRLYSFGIYGRILSHPNNACDIYKDIVNILLDKNADLVQVIHIHESFAKEILDHIKLEELTENKTKWEAAFYQHSILGENNRGRLTSNTNVIPTYRFGISKNKVFQSSIGNSNEAHRCGIDEFSPDKNSFFYKKISKNDIPFISGISGHTARLFIAAFTYGELRSLEEIKQYFAAICSYLISGGNHSFHEIAVVGKIAGLGYRIGSYLSCLPDSLIHSDSFFVLRQQFPEYLDINSEEDKQLVV